MPLHCSTQKSPDMPEKSKGVFAVLKMGASVLLSMTQKVSHQIYQALDAAAADMMSWPAFASLTRIPGGIAPRRRG